MTVNVSDLISQLEGAKVDLTVPTQGAPREVIPAGSARARLVGYIETGVHLRPANNGYKETRNMAAQLLFEISGPKHPPIEIDGQMVLPIITVFLDNVSTNEKAGYFKLFQKMNERYGAKHYTGLLGKTFKVVVHHYAKGDKVIAKLTNPISNEIDVAPPFVENADTGELIELTVAPQVSPTRCFLWNFPSVAQWKSLTFQVDSTEDSYSQKQIKASLGFVGSKVEEVVTAAESTMPTEIDPTEE